MPGVKLTGSSWVFIGRWHLSGVVFHFFLPQWHATIHDLNYTLPCDESVHNSSRPLCLSLQEEDPVDTKTESQ